MASQYTRSVVRQREAFRTLGVPFASKAIHHRVSVCHLIGGLSAPGEQTVDRVKSEIGVPVVDEPLGRRVILGHPRPLRQSRGDKSDQALILGATLDREAVDIAQHGELGISLTIYKPEVP